MPLPFASYWCTQMVHFQEGSLPRLLASATHTPPSAASTGALRGYVFREGPCHAVLHLHGNTASGRLLPVTQLAHLRDETPATPPSIDTITPILVISYRRTQVVNLSRGPLTPTYICTRVSPPAVSYRRTPMERFREGVPATPPFISYRRIHVVNLPRGALATSLCICMTTLPPVVFYRRTQMVLF